MAGVNHFVVMTDRKHGTESKYYDRRHPTLRADGSVWTSPQDGDILGPIPVKANIQYTTAFPANLETLGAMMHAMSKRETVYRIFGAELFLTESRIIIAQLKPPSIDHRTVGHLRFPWITSVGFRPKQSFLNESTLEIDFQEDMDDGDGVWFHSLTLTFPKQFEPGSLAQKLVQRIASHHLSHGCPSEVVPDLHELAQVERLPDPAKGELSQYFTPAFVPFPHGAEYVGDGRQSADWRGPKISDISNDSAEQLESLPGEGSEEKDETV